MLNLNTNFSHYFSINSISISVFSMKVPTKQSVILSSSHMKSMYSRINFIRNKSNFFFSHLLSFCLTFQWVQKLNDEDCAIHWIPSKPKQQKLTRWNVYMISREFQLQNLTIFKKEDICKRNCMFILCPL